MFCTQCGEENDLDSKFCLKCGAPFKKSKTTKEDKKVKESKKDEIEEKEEPVKNKKSKKKLIIALVVILLIIIAILLWWFNRKFDVTFKYNNGLEDYTVKVKYLKTIKDENVKKDLTKQEANFVGYFETYALKEKQIEKLKKDEKLKDTICKDGFKVNSELTKCVSEKEFDFKGTKIKKNTQIEALWSTIKFTIDPTSKTITVEDSFNITATITGTNNKEVKWSSDNSGIATVDSNGKVTGLKEGKTRIVAESNGIKRTCDVTVEKKKDNGKISLSTSSKCLIGPDQVATITASVTNAIDKTVNWTLPSKCYTVQKVSDTVVKVNRIGRDTQCRTDEETPFNVSAKLNNGSSSSVSISFEPTLTFTVYNNGSTVLEPENGIYWGNNVTVKTNQKASFDATDFGGANRVREKTDTSVSVSYNGSATVTIKTNCGQTKTIEIKPIIN